MNQLYLLGTADGSANAERNHSAYLYQLGESAIQIDCGDGASRAFKGLGLSYDTADRLIISHLHSDHVGGLFMLLQGYWLAQRRKQLVINLPADAIEPIRQMLQAGYLFEEQLQFRLSFEALSAGHPIRLPDVTITPHYTTHLESTRRKFQAKYPARYEAFSFLIETASDLRIAHSADLGAAKDLVPLLDKPVDLLVCELAHFEPTELFSFLQGRSIKQLVLIHLLEQYIRQREQIAKLASEMLPETHIEFAEDGRCLEF